MSSREGGRVCPLFTSPLQACGLWKKAPTSTLRPAASKTAAARHTDKILQIVPFIKNLSCRNPQKRRPNTLWHPQTCPLLSFPLFAHCTQKKIKIMRTTHQSQDGCCLRGGRECASCSVNSSFLCHLPRSVTNPGRYCEWEAACTELDKLLSHGIARWWGRRGHISDCFQPVSLCGVGGSDKLVNHIVTPQNTQFFLNRADNS